MLDYLVLGMRKAALAPQTVISALTKRMAQGAKVAPRAGLAVTGGLRGVEHAPPALRALALDAGASVRANQQLARKAEAAVPGAASNQARIRAGYEHAVASPEAVRSSVPLRHATDQGATGMSGATTAYSQRHLDQVAPVRGALHPSDPLLVGGRTPAHINTQTPRGIPATRPGADPYGHTTLADPTQVGLLGGRTLGDGHVLAPSSMQGIAREAGTAVGPIRPRRIQPVTPVTQPSALAGAA